MRPMPASLRALTRLLGGLAPPPGRATEQKTKPGKDRSKTKAARKQRQANRRKK